MALQLCTDVSPAAWLADPQVPWDRLVTLGPDGFEAYARLRYIPDPTGPDQSENDAVLPDDHPSDVSRVVRALHLLAPFTATPTEAFFCRWDGYSDLGLPADCPLVTLPDLRTAHRSYALLSGSVADIDTWVTSETAGDWPPAFVWPADRAWCFTSDVDPHWAGIAASQAAIDVLLAEPGLDVVQVRPTDVMPTYY